VNGNEVDPYGWTDAGDDVVYWFHLFSTAKDPLTQAGALVELSNHVHDLKTWLPTYDGDTMTVAWEREDQQ
jgi:hypothetical protein